LFLGEFMLFDRWLASLWIAIFDFNKITILRSAQN
jgi:hypothetical protein